ncbi:hypothetical protein Dimus_012642 [Dionaea muscipula]
MEKDVNCFLIALLVGHCFSASCFESLNPITMEHLMTDWIQLGDGCPSFMRRPRKATIGVCDSLGRLPDELLIIILERLPIENAIATSLLSRRWRNLWRHMSIVDFDPDWAAQRKNVLHYISFFLENHQGQKIQRFCVSLCYTTGMLHAIWCWLTSVAAKHVEELSIDLNDQNYGRRYLSFNLPPLLSNCSTLVRLRLKFVELTIVPPPFPSSLKEVLFDEVKLPKDGIEQITLSCPHLEMLSLTNCNRKSDLQVIISPSCTHLRLIICEDLKRVGSQTEMYISGSKITSIEFVSAMPREKYQVDIEVGVGAKFLLDKMSDGRQTMKVTSRGLLGKHYSDNLHMLLYKVRTTDMLVLSSWCIQVLAVDVIVNKNVPNLLVNHLLLELGLKWREFMGIAHILAVCPRLKSICIVVSQFPGNQELDLNDAFARARVKWFGNLFGRFQLPNRHGGRAKKELQVLDVVEFRNYSGDYQMWEDWSFDEGRFFAGTECGSQVLKLLLRTAKNLKRVIFVSSKKRHVMKMNLHTIQQLCRFPRF